MSSASRTNLREVAYFRTGGTAEVVCAPTTVADLARVVREAASQGRRIMALGGGTNSLVSDEHFPGVVILFKALRRLEVRGEEILVGAGVENSDLARAALAHGLDGAAWMYRLPGQLGGTVRMNARCYGGEVSQIARRVVVVTPAGEIREYEGGGVFRGYKDTTLMASGELVAEVTLKLRPGEAGRIEARMLDCERDRVAKGQFEWPSCGCVYKNDYSVGVPSGMLLEAAGVKNMSRGGAVVSAHHANFIFNRGATSRDILELSLAMREAVYGKFGVWLEYEMEILGDVPKDLAARVGERRASVPQVEALAPLRERMAKR